MGIRGTLKVIINYGIYNKNANLKQHSFLCTFNYNHLWGL